jgi:hypothetical protein
MLQRHRGRGLLPPSLRTSESFPSDLRSTRPKCANPRSVIVANLLQPIYRDHPRPAIKGSRGVSRPRRCFPRASRFPHVRALPFASTRSKPDRAKPRRFGDARLDRCRVRALLRCAQILGDHLRRSLAYRTRTDAHVVEHALAQRADGRLAHWGSCLEGWSACPPSIRKTEHPLRDLCSINVVTTPEPSRQSRAAFSRASGFVPWHETDAHSVHLISAVDCQGTLRRHREIDTIDPERTCGRAAASTLDVFVVAVSGGGICVRRQAELKRRTWGRFAVAHSRPSWAAP